MIKNIRRLGCYFILCGYLLTLSACGYTLEDLIELDEQERIAERNAIAYIEDKYGFTPSVIKSECDTIDIGLFYDSSPDPTGYVYVELYHKKEGIRFWVYSTGTEEGIQECWDNYQYREIEQAVYEQMEDLLGTNVEHVDLTYGKFEDSRRTVNATDKVDKEYGLIKDFFDGTNLGEVLSNAEHNKMSICMVNAPEIPDLLGWQVGERTEEGIYEGVLPKSNEIVQSLGENLNCLFVNYRDTEAYNVIHSEGCVPGFTTYSLGDGMEKECIYIKDQYYISAMRSKEEVCTEYRKYEVKAFDEFYYVAMGGTYCNFVEADDIMHEDYIWNGRGFLNAQKVYGAYRVDSDADRVYVFIPVNTLKVDTSIVHKIDDENTRVVFQREFHDTEEGWEMSYGTDPACIVGDLKELDTEKYISTTIYLHDFYRNIIFSVFIDEEEFE